MNIGGGAAGALRGWRADPLRLGLAALLLLLIALVGAAIAMLATPPPREATSVISASPPAAPAAAPAPAPQAPVPAEAAASPRLPGGVGPAVSGPAQIVDTATLRVGDRIVSLKGVRGEAGAEARAMAGWLDGREVRCERVAAQFHRCEADGWDLAEVVLFNGGGRAAPDASPAQRKSERQARDARRGIWASR